MGRGSVTQANGSGSASSADIARERRLYEAYERLCVSLGPRLRKVTLTTFQVTCDAQRNAVEALRDYQKHLPERVSAGEGIVLCGPSGTGKDHLAVSILKCAMMRDRLSGMYVPGLELFSEMRDVIGSHTSETQFVARFCTTDILLLSDPLPPRGSLTDFQAAMLETIVDWRYRHLRPTFITLNVATGQEADERLGVPIVDRLRHGATVIKCDWPSFRKPKE